MAIYTDPYARKEVTHIMSKRDQFAMAALPAFLSNVQITPENAVLAAYRTADLMMAESQK